MASNPTAKNVQKESVGFPEFVRRILAVSKHEVDEAEKTLPPAKRGRKATDKATLTPLITSSFVTKE